MTATTSATITFLLTHGSDRNDVNNVSLVFIYSNMILRYDTSCFSLSLFQEGLSLATLSWISGRVDLVEALIE
jgi:hypothetical protein